MPNFSDCFEYSGLETFLLITGAEIAIIYNAQVPKFKYF